MGLLSNILKGGASKPASPAARPTAKPRPDPKAENNYIIVILDSLRYDAFCKADPKVITRLTGGEVERRWTYASWTAPSHYNLLTGLLPHHSPQNVFASEYYKEDFLNYNKRLGTKDMEFGKLVPHLWLPTFLQEGLGYRTHAKVSLPVLNNQTGINRGFDTFQLMDSHNDMNSMLDEMTFPEDRPSFYMLNVGETHYPYATPDEDPSEWPKISGVHGVFKHMGDAVSETEEEGPKFFDQDRLDTLRDRQVHTVNYLEGVFERLFDMVPKNTFITVTADHGELFGEKGYFGHGPIQHDKVYEVPFLEGKIR